MPQQRQDYLLQTRATSQALSLRGTSISQQLWDEIVASTVFEGGQPVVALNLAGAEVSARIHFVDREFRQYVELSGATFFESMEYRRCTFRAALIAHHARFDGGPPAFYQCNFQEDIDVSYGQVSRVSLGLEGCKFGGAFRADGFSGGGLILSRSEVQGAALFRHSRAHLIFNEVEFNDAVDLHDAECTGFTGEQLSVRTAHRLGPFSVTYLHLARASFGARVLIEVQAKDVNLSSAAFDQGGMILVEKAALQLEQVRLGGPLRISGMSETSDKPQILSLRNADAGKMSFAHLDLSRCSFQGAHGLGTLEIESTVSLPSAPWWRGGRRFIADEYAWRSSVGRMHKLGWKLQGVNVGLELPKRSPGTAQPVLLRPLDAAQVSAIYRELRRSLETKSDMPGAADFYYGEMEMRRWVRGRGWFERILVWCYWLTCGYGLRAGRPILFWLLLVALGSICFLRFGYASPPSSQQAVLSAVRSAIPGFSATPSLTLEGQWIEIVLRVFGAVAIALFLLSARSLVMRKPGE